MDGRRAAAALPTALLLAASLFGCGAPTTGVRAGWYYVPRVNADLIYLSLINEGIERVTITRVVINEGAEATPGWRYATALVLEPGEVRLIPLPQFTRNGTPFPRCGLPVRVQVEIPQGWATAEGVPATPSVIPRVFEGCTGPSTTGGSAAPK